MPGNLQTPGNIVVELDFRQPKNSNSSRKRKILLADRRRKAVERLQMKTRILNVKLTAFTSNFRERSTSRSSSFQNQSEATTPRSKADTEIRPCDGIGGTPKRLDEAVKQEKVNIQDGSDFMKLAEKNQLKSAIKFLFVDKNNTEDSRAYIMAQSENLKPCRRYNEDPQCIFPCSK